MLFFFKSSLSFDNFCMIRILDNPFHSWIHASICCSFLAFRGFLSGLLLISQIILAIISSSLNPAEEIRSFVTKNVDICGGVSYLLSFCLSLLFGLLVGSISAVGQLYSIRKFRKNLARKSQQKLNSQEDDEELKLKIPEKLHKRSNSSRKVIDVEQVSEERENESSKIARTEKNKNGKTTCNMFAFLFEKDISNDQLKFGLQMSTKVKKFDCDTLTELLQERTLDNHNKESMALNLSTIIFFVTRRRLEKKKIVELAPIFQESMMELLRKLETKRMNLIDSVRFRCIKGFFLPILFFCLQVPFLNFMFSKKNIFSLFVRRNL